MCPWRVVFAVCSALLATLSVADARCQNTASSCTFRDVGIEEHEFQEMLQILAQAKKNKRPVTDTNSNKPRITAQPEAQRAFARTNRKQKLAVAKPVAEESLRFYLRKNFQDITLFTDPTSTEEAEGAEFSWTYDKLTNNTVWTAEGIVAAAYSYLVIDERSKFIGAAIGPYFSFAREIHSKNAKNNVDMKKFGISGEIGWQNPVFQGGDYIRGSAAVMQDDIESASVAHVTIEWLPTWIWTHTWGGFDVGAVHVNWNFTPEVKVQYDSIADNGNSTLNFSGQRRSLRIGPEAVLWFKLNTPIAGLNDVFRKSTGKIVYHWWTEAYSGRQESWLDASIVHNLDEAGFVALKFAYRNGRNEDTGVHTNLFKIALSAKTCVDINTKGVC